MLYFILAFVSVLSYSISFLHLAIYSVIVFAPRERHLALRRRYYTWLFILYLAVTLAFYSAPRSGILPAAAGVTGLPQRSALELAVHFDLCCFFGSVFVFRCMFSYHYYTWLFILYPDSDMYCHGAPQALLAARSASRPQGPRRGAAPFAGSEIDPDCRDDFLFFY